VTIRTLIADDEALSRRLLRQLLSRHADVAIVAECEDGAAAAEARGSHEVDVMFLDVCMPLASGLEVADRGRSTGSGAGEAGSAPLIVFVTAFDDYAVRAFDVDAVDYLMKPLEEARLDSALERVRARLEIRRVARERSFALEATEGEANRTERGYLSHLVTRVGRRDVVVSLETIEYIHADDVYADVHAGGRRHVIRSSLDALERVLDPARFARVHRSFIVPLSRVREMRRRHTPELVLDTGVVIPVSRRRRAQLDQFLRPHAHGASSFTDRQRAALERPRP